MGIRDFLTPWGRRASGSRQRALEIFRGTLPPQRSEEVQGRKISSAPRDLMAKGPGYNFLSICSFI